MRFCSSGFSLSPPFKGRGVPCGLPDANKAVATPLPSRGGVGVGSVLLLLTIAFVFLISMLQKYKKSPRTAKRFGEILVGLCLWQVPSVC